MALKKNTPQKRSSPLSDSDDIQLSSQNDVVQQQQDDDSSSASDKSSPKSSGSKPIQVSSKKPDPKPSKKRGASDNKKKSGNNKKKAKRVDDKGVFSEDDEIAILNGMIDYENDPASDYKVFLGFVSDSIHFDVSVKQLRGKIRSLKEKYLAKVEKGVAFVKPHDEKVFDLSRKIWGGGNDDEKDNDVEKAEDIENGGDEGVAVEEENGDEEDVEKVEDVENGGDEGVAVEEENAGSDFKEMYPFLSQVWESEVDFPQALRNVCVAKFKMSGSGRIRGLEKECKAVVAKDLELYLEKLELKTKLAELVMDQMTSADP